MGEESKMNRVEPRGVRRELKNQKVVQLNSIQT